MNSHLILITSPPASGKTYWIRNLSKALGEDSILVISPLRALADECRQKWDNKIAVMTPEEWMTKKVFKSVVIFDEFHLFYYWGDTFRPLLWEVFYELSYEANLNFLLTATVSEEMRQNISLFSSHFQEMHWMDFGNQKLKFLPEKYVKGLNKKWIMNQILMENPGESVKLIFCQYRNEVFEIYKLLSERGFQCIPCIGGESKYMQDRLKSLPSPDFIISTTVLSHGVNLPEITKIYFLYKVNNLDFWIQMIARGGRKGEKYTVVSLEKPYQLKWSFFKNMMIVAWLSFKEKMSLREGLLPP